MGRRVGTKQMMKTRSSKPKSRLLLMETGPWPSENGTWQTRTRDRVSTSSLRRRSGSYGKKFSRRMRGGSRSAIVPSRPARRDRLLFQQCRVSGRSVRQKRIGVASLRWGSLGRSGSGGQREPLREFPQSRPRSCILRRQANQAGRKSARSMTWSGNGNVVAPSRQSWPSIRRQLSSLTVMQCCTRKSAVRRLGCREADRNAVSWFCSGHPTAPNGLLPTSQS